MGSYCQKCLQLLDNQPQNIMKKIQEVATTHLSLCSQCCNGNQCTFNIFLRHCKRELTITDNNLSIINWMKLLMIYMSKEYTYWKDIQILVIKEYNIHEYQLIKFMDKFRLVHEEDIQKTRPLSMHVLKNRIIVKKASFYLSLEKGAKYKFTGVLTLTNNTNSSITFTLQEGQIFLCIFDYKKNMYVNQLKTTLDAGMTSNVRISANLVTSNDMQNVQAPPKQQNFYSITCFKIREEASTNHSNQSHNTSIFYGNTSSR